MAYPFFYIIGNSSVRNILLYKKRSAKDRTPAEWKVLLAQPAEGEECRKRHSFLLGKEGMVWKKRKCK